jgi:hypothetical protein
VLSTPSPRRARLVRLGLATSAVLILAAPAAAVVWPDDEPVSATASTTEASAPASSRVAPSVGAETWVELEDEPVAGEEALPAPLAVRTRPSEKARLVDLGRSEQVVATGETRGRWAEVVVDDVSRWVRRAALADTGTEPEAREETRRSPQVGGRKPGAGGAAARPQPGSGAAPAPGTAPSGEAAAPAPKPAPQPAPQTSPAASEPVQPTQEASEPTPAPSATADEPAPAWEPAPETEPTEDPAPDPAQDPVVDPWATLPPELEPAPDLAAALE